MEKSLSLFKISQDLLEVFYAIEENEGELTPEIEEALSIKHEQLNDKGVSYRKAIVYLQSQQKIIKEEVDRLNKAKKQLERGTERLQANLLQAVLMFGEEDKPTKSQEKSGLNGTKRLTVREVGNIVNLSNRQTQVCNIENEETLPSEYLRLSFPKINKRKFVDAVKEGDKAFFAEMLVSSKEEVEKSLITNDLKAGKEIKGASLEVSHSLTIK